MEEDGRKNFALTNEPCLDCHTARSGGVDPGAPPIRNETKGSQPMRVEGVVERERLCLRVSAGAGEESSDARCDVEGVDVPAAAAAHLRQRAGQAFGG